MRKIFFLFLTALSGSLAAQTISFDIRVFGSSIGKMNVTHTRETDGTDLYTMESNSRAKFLWITKTYRSVFEARYKNGKFISSSHLETENEKPKRWAKVSFDGKQYQVDSDKGKRTFAELPVSCDASLYFDDYRKINRLFYLPDAGFDDVKHIDDNSLEFKSADGHRNIYFFDGGKIKGMEFHLALATVYMSRIN